MPPEALRRLRWRRRGAWQWPTFAGAVVGEALLLHLAPVAGGGTDVVAAGLLALAGNLAIVAVVAPLAGLAVRRRRADLPPPVARDYAATGLILLFAGAVTAGWWRMLPAVVAEGRAFQAQSDAVRLYVRLHAPAAYQQRIDAADTWRVEANLFRTCVPGTDPQRRLCLFVDTALRPPGITVDPNRAPNSTYVGPSAVGRGRG